MIKRNVGKDDVTMAKVCATCRMEQPESNFSKGRKSPDGLNYSCKDCAKAYRETHRERISAQMKQHYAENRESILKRIKVWKDNNKEKIRESSATYYEVHGEALIHKSKVWRENNREKKLAYGRAYKEANPERIKVWRDNNKDKMKKSHGIWSKNNPDKIRIHGQTRRAKKVGLVSTLTTAQWEHILDKFNNTCAYCGTGDKTLHQEHFIALSSGGEYGNDNIIPACGSCNSSKGTKDFFTWYPTSQCYDSRREKKIMKFLHYTGSTQQLTLCT